ncbi:MAG: dockerin type I repeat-containing protein [Oscillospiraceae bacterium]|nr:dockerin type I repeat-containing protein [Oscillospiraceae bacterium]
MKKRMKFAAILAAALTLGTCCPSAYAEPELHYFGVMDDGVFHTLQVLDDRGLLQNWALSRLDGVNENTPYYICTYHVDHVFDPADPERYIWGDMTYVVAPRENALQLTLRENVNPGEAKQQLEEIIRRYFPLAALGSSGSKTISIIVKDETLRSPEYTDSFMHEVVQTGLISGFYTWGETAQYHWIEHGFLTLYRMIDSRGNVLNYDWPAIEAWLKEYHPECEVVSIMDSESDLAKTMAINYYSFKNAPDVPYAVAIIPPEDIAFLDHFALAMELMEKFDLPFFAHPTPYENEYQPLTGRNALAIPGDLNIDCTVDVSDAVLAAKFASGDSSAALIDLGKQNGDLNGDENVTLEDVTAILRMIAKLT